MSKKSAIGLTVLLCIGLLLSTLQFGSITEPDEAEQAIGELAYQAYAVGINTVLYDINGKISYTLSADKQTQFSDETTLLENPLIRLYQQGDPIWNVIANTGTIPQSINADSAPSRTMILNGDVQVYSLNEFGNLTVMTTDTLDVDFDQEQLSTSKPVLVKTDMITQTALGLFADLKTDKITFYENIKGQYVSKKSN